MDLLRERVGTGEQTAPASVTFARVTRPVKREPDPSVISIPLTSGRVYAQLNPHYAQKTEYPASLASLSALPASPNIPKQRKQRLRQDEMRELNELATAEGYWAAGQNTFLLGDFNTGPSASSSSCNATLSDHIGVECVFGPDP